MRTINNTLNMAGGTEGTYAFILGKISYLQKLHVKTYTEIWSIWNTVYRNVSGSAQSVRCVCGHSALALCTSYRSLTHTNVRFSPAPSSQRVTGCQLLLVHDQKHPPDAPVVSIYRASRDPPLCARDAS